MLKELIIFNPPDSMSCFNTTSQHHKIEKKKKKTEPNQM
jgi:hypothetical protein